MNNQKEYYVATCGACFRTQRVHDKKMVLHGYTRPGYGSVEGQCFGAHKTPFQLSKKTTEEYISYLEKEGVQLFAKLDEAVAEHNISIETEQFNFSDSSFCCGNIKNYFDLDEEAKKRFKIKIDGPREARNNIRYKVFRPIQKDIADVERNIAKCDEYLSKWVKGKIIPASQLPRQAKTPHVCKICDFELTGSYTDSSLIDGVEFNCKRCDSYDMKTLIDMKTIIDEKFKRSQITRSKAGRLKLTKEQRHLANTKLANL